MEIAQNEMLVTRVGIAEGAVVRTPEHLRTTGLGSCVGAVIYDKNAGYAGMVHVMLPTAPDTGTNSVTKYANTAIPWLIHELIFRGCNIQHLKAKLAGGAQMFAAAIKNDFMRVGPRNVDAVKVQLDLFRIPIIAEDVGGNVGRTIEFDLLTEALLVRTALAGTYSI